MSELLSVDVGEQPQLLSKRSGFAILLWIIGRIEVASVGGAIPADVHDNRSIRRACKVIHASWL